MSLAVNLELGSQQPTTTRKTNLVIILKYIKSHIYFSYVKFHFSFVISCHFIYHISDVLSIKYITLLILLVILTPFIGK